jgi:hypothetical protein
VHIVGPPRRAGEPVTGPSGLLDRLAEVVNVAIAVNMDRYQLSEYLGASRNECARALGIAGPSASERAARGREVIARRLEAAGAVKFSEAAREREVIEAAGEHAVVSLAEYRARHAAA